MNPVIEYEVQPDFMIRVPRFPAYEDRLEASRLDWSTELVANEFHSDSYLRTALGLASPTTNSALSNAFESEDSTVIASRLSRTLRRYWIRAHTRPTPFGLFSGVGFGKLSGKGLPEVNIKPISGVTARPDLGWVAHVISTVSSDDGKADAAKMPVRLNPFLYSVGGRFILPNTNTLGEKDSFTVDFRATEPVQKVIDWVHEGKTRSQIESLLADVYPDTPEEVRTGMLEQLFKQHVLSDHPLPSMTFKTVLSDTLPLGAYSETERSELKWIEDSVGAVKAPQDVVERVGEITDRQRRISPDYEGEVLSVESVVGLQREELCEEVGKSVERLAELLVTIGAPWRRLPYLVDYENSFIERFGAMAEVPLLKLLGEEVGLGAPEGYSFPATGFRAKGRGTDTNPARESTLKELLDMTLLLGQRELVLTKDQILAMNEAVDRNGAPAPTSMDLFVTVHGRDDAIAQGQHQVVFRGTVCDGARAWGRFAGMFDDRSRKSIDDFYDWDAEQHPTERTVQLNYFAATGKGSNVARSDTVADLEICVNCAATLPADRQVDLEDILVGSAGDGFYLRWAVTGERIRVIQNHLLNYAMAPNPVRFLLEVSEDGTQPLYPFEWDGCGSVPFLPRVRVDNLILFPGRWLMSSRPFSHAGLLETKTFVEELAEVRRRLSIPRHVYLTENDNRLLLDLEREDDADLLRDELNGEPGEISQVTLEETLFEPDELIVKDSMGRRYHSEFVFTLRRKSSSAGAYSNKSRVLPKCLARTQFGLMADTDWLSVEMYGKQRILDRLVGELPSLIGDMGEVVERWFFIRYASDGDHIRLRVRPKASGFAESLAFLKNAGGRLIGEGVLNRFNIVDYRAETNRYGGLDCIEAAFDVFEKSSVYAAALAASSIWADIDGDVLGVLLIDEILSASGMEQTVLAEIGEVNSRHPARARFREVKRVLGALLEPGGRDESPIAAELLANFGWERDGFLSAVKRHGELVGEASDRCGLVVAPVDICHSVIHMHLNRCIPASRADEAGSYSLLAVAKKALAQRARALGKQGVGK